MRVLCCLDGSNLEQLSLAISGIVAKDALTLGFIYVTDTGPRKEVERQTGPLMRRVRPDDPRFQQMQQAEEEASQEILAESRVRYPNAETIRREGRPEREIVNYAAEWNADLILLCPRSPQHGSPAIGPRSVGHVARFVLDHAPCPVLLVRPLNRRDFPLSR